MKNLYIVATPIGNLADITLRALETLQSVGLILAEDTRHTRILLQKYDIKTHVESFHAHSTPQKLAQVLGILHEKDLAYVSDAGTPGISDPGYLLVKGALEMGARVVPIPGVSAVITALSASGLPTDKFLYLGFLPVKKGRQTLFNALREEERTVVFYESPHRMLKTLSQMNDFFPQRRVVLARELTKFHEEFFRGTVAEALVEFTQRKPKGEFTVILGSD